MAEITPARSDNRRRTGYERSPFTVDPVLRLTVRRKPVSRLLCGYVGRMRYRDTAQAAVIVLTMLLAAAGLGGDAVRYPGCEQLPDGLVGEDKLTPYPTMAGTGFLRGATLELDGRLDRDPAALIERLRAMRDQYRIDTVGVYRLDDPDALLTALGRLGMTAVPRLEEYDPDSFAFTPTDVDRLLARYAPLLTYLAAPARRARVAYLAVTMPLDDPRVQTRLGGVNSPLSRTRQLEYASAVVARLREVAPGLPVYLGVFYGWGGGYRPPSYRPAGADGYFLTSYSYPGNRVPGRDDPDDALIDAPGRRATMARFRQQYGDAPVVVEYGVQTAGGRADPRHGQTAGLVADRAAKARALVATTRFYCAGYPSVRGTMYFGFNVNKTEGDPPARVDWGLSTAG